MWSCSNCPLDAARISFERPRSSSAGSYPRLPHARVQHEYRCASSRQIGNSYFLENTTRDPPHAVSLSNPEMNVRRPYTVLGEKYSCTSGAHYYYAGPRPSKILRSVDKERISPVSVIRKVCRYNLEDESSLSAPETDGKVYKVELPCSEVCYIYLRAVGEDTSYTIVVRITYGGWIQAGRSIRTMCFSRPQWPSITGFVIRDFLSVINNLSPRAWDSKRIQKRGARREGIRSCL